ncbi:uncharacterized protein LOC116770397 isoform X2 [Danaus plexippus]|uniref:uncharacterized protein LOC116770397 isoform X2 n=1 Tax=Danaus plexippus TaxID=13037 RepID=UPI002AB275D8|nr:uncharacterized protein LOC116770397 isoform X2 [Danaus plexippus]
MCCIFTCCGWMVDLLQRLWTFTMSCFISSAVCCSLVTASMSGIALGYNYSLAEYIDLKETNVSVFLKRGVFDDEISDEMDWRRSGHMPIGGHVRDHNLITGASDESTTLRSGRRLDDSIYESNDRNNFEGSLMRLTAKPIETSSTLSTTDRPLDDVLNQYTMGSLDQLKAVQGEINRKKGEAAKSLRKFNRKQEIVVPERRPIFPYNDGSGRRAMSYTIPTYQPRSTYSSLRAAVPDDRINNPSKWILPKLPPESLPWDMQYADDYMSQTYPSPITPRAGPARPTRPPGLARTRIRPTHTTTTLSPIKQPMSPKMDLPKSMDEDIEAFKKKLMEDKFIPPSLKDEDFLKKMDIGKINPNEDYEEDIKGVPMRRKRNVNNLITPKNNFVNENETKTEASKDSVISTQLGGNVGKIDLARSIDVLNKKFFIGYGGNTETSSSGTDKTTLDIFTKLFSSTLS